MKRALWKIIRNTYLFFGFDIKKIDKRFYLKDELKWLKDLNINTILDIGANIGQSALYFHEKMPEAVIYSFEPIKQCFDLLEKKTKHIKQIKSYNYALGDKNDFIMINKNEFTESSSILALGENHKKAYTFAKKTIQEKIEVKKIDDIWDSLILKDQILAKIDVQGFELSVLKGAVKSLPKIKVLILETSFTELYKDQVLFPEIYDFLKSRGFAYSGSLGDMKSPTGGSIIQQNSLFIRMK